MNITLFYWEKEKYIDEKKTGAMKPNVVEFSHDSRLQKRKFAAWSDPIAHEKFMKSSCYGSEQQINSKPSYISKQRANQ